MKQTKIISGFPAIGKSFLSKQNLIKVLDSDSSTYSWTIENGEKIRNKDFPNNYLQHIRENIGKVDVILVSSHKDVRQILNQNKIETYLVYPDVSLKDEYIQRYIDRGNDETFIKFISDNWENFIEDLEQSNMNKVVLKYGEYLSHVIGNILSDVSVQTAMTTLTTALKEDYSYYISWQANIAMAFKDEFDWTYSKKGDDMDEYLFNDTGIIYLYIN
jgi:hypothetical protein